MLSLNIPPQNFSFILSGISLTLGIRFKQILNLFSIPHTATNLRITNNFHFL